jgi:hypothetical protein
MTCDLRDGDHRRRRDVGFAFEPFTGPEHAGGVAAARLSAFIGMHLRLDQFSGQCYFASVATRRHTRCGEIARGWLLLNSSTN